MDLQTNDAAADLSDTDTPLQSAVWLIEDLDISMPPIPGVYEERLEEVSLGRLFATDAALLDLDSPGSITEALNSGWPKAGLAFGYVARGTGGRWFYTLTSERLVLHISLRLQNLDDETGRVSAVLVSQAHGKLERFLSEAHNYFQAISPDALPDDVARRIISFSDADGVPVETHASWTSAGGLTAFVERDQVFADNSPAEPMGFERVIWG